MKNHVQIAIPSYKRAKTVRDKTLTTLTRLNVNPSVVTIFVGDAEQEVEYREVLKNTPYKNIVVGVPGMGAIRNFIQSYYPEDTYILNLDDDLIEINRRMGEKSLGQIADLNEIVRDGFEACEKEGARLWGIYAASNPFFMKDRIAVGLYYVIGSMWGCINKHGDAYNVTLDDKEDFERSIKYYLANGKVCRLDYITVKSNYYKEPGGMQVTRTTQRIEESAKVLVERYPDLCTMYYRETTGHAELKLKDRRKESGSSLEDLFG